MAPPGCVRRATALGCCENAEGSTLMAGHCPVLPRLPVLGAPVRFGDRVRRDSLGVQQR